MRSLSIILALIAFPVTLHAASAVEIIERCPSIPLDLVAEMTPPNTPAAVYLGWLHLSKSAGPARALLAATEVRAALACEKRHEIADADLLKALHWAGMDAAGYQQPEAQRDVMTVLEIVAQSTTTYDSTIYPYFMSGLGAEEEMVRATAAGKLILYRERPEAVLAVATLLDNQATRTQGLNALAIIFNDPWVPLEYGRPIVKRVRRALFSVDATDDRALAATVLGKLAKEAQEAIVDLEIVRDSDKSAEVRQYAAIALRNVLRSDKYYEERIALRGKKPQRRRPS